MASETVGTHLRRMAILASAALLTGSLGRAADLASTYSGAAFPTAVPTAPHPSRQRRRTRKAAQPARKPAASVPGKDAVRKEDVPDVARTVFADPATERLIAAGIVGAPDDFR